MEDILYIYRETNNFVLILGCCLLLVCQVVSCFENVKASELCFCYWPRTDFCQFACAEDSYILRLSIAVNQFVLHRYM